jgi:ubiquinone/menaquinone biosynthesis C-methylase UbiE
MTSENTEKSRISWDPKNIFAGTAWYYARYRPDYPEQVFRLLVDKFRLSRNSRVLDLGCGTGQIALKLAPYVAKVVALDPQEDMLKEGKTLASARNISNITWLAGESGNLSSLTPLIGEVDITCMGRAFHWMDRVKTLQDLYQITKPGGGIAVIADTQPRFKPDVPWISVIDESVKHWLGNERKAGTTGTFTPFPKRHEEIIKESDFINLESIDIQQTRQWTIDQIIGYLYSASPTSLPVLGDKKERFEADLRKKLGEMKPSGWFEEEAVISIQTAMKA